MSNLSADQILNAIVVILAILAAIVAVDKFVDVIKKWKAPEKDVISKLQSDKKDIERHEKDIQTLKDGQKAMCSGVIALLDHQLHNGNTDQMEQAKHEITEYLKNLI